MLDAFAGEGGAAVGYALAGWDVTCVDNNAAKLARNPLPQKIHADAVRYIADHGHKYDVIHASPPCKVHYPPGLCLHPARQPVGVYGTGGGGQQTRGYKAHPEEARAVMGMPWASRDGVSQAIPPVYTQWIGEQLLALVKS